MKTNALCFPALVVASLAAPLVAVDVASAACADSTGVVLNEIRYRDVPSPGGGRLNALVELYNRGSVGVAVGGWRLTDESATGGATLPAVTIPARSFLMVEFGTGSTELDFSDRVGHIFTNADSMGVFDPDEGGVALYSGTPGPATIADFVAWSPTGASSAGIAATHAIAASRWPASGSIAVVDPLGLFTLRLQPDGVDQNDIASWHRLSWGDSWYQRYIAGPNPAQVEPELRSAVAPGAVHMSWSAPRHSGASRRLLVATTANLASGIVVDGLITSPDTTVVLPTGAYYWTLADVSVCGEVRGVVWSFEVFEPPAPSLVKGSHAMATTLDDRVLGVTRIKQRKDTRLLCLWNGANQTRGGCTRDSSSNGPWDAPHGADHALVCNHCGWYCVRASCQMINEWYGGNLSQDRVSVLSRQVQSLMGTPEDTLGHGAGILPVNIALTLSACLSGAAITPGNADYAELRAAILDGNPAIVVARPDGVSGSHAMVVDGFIDANAIAPGRPAANMIDLVDPWPSKPERRLVAMDSVFIRNQWTVSAAPGQTIAGVQQEIEVVTDTDHDGVMDFDEGAPNYPAARPRRLQSRPDDADTDHDDLKDKTEIAGYTFYTCGNNDALTFPDIDGDNLRAEGDCDSDNGGLFDGGEDALSTGTCTTLHDPFSAADDGIEVHTDKPLYFVIEDVKLAGSPFQADTSYGFANIPLCPDLVNGQAIGSGGGLTTNGLGIMPYQSVATCVTPGVALVVVDVLHNGIYEEPQCQNPLTCWICAGPIYINSLDDAGRWSELAKVKYKPTSITWLPTPDFMHNHTGLHAELNGPGNPGNPIDVALRLPSFVVNPGDRVYLSYWTAFFSQGMNGTVRLSIDGGNQWTNVRNYGPPQNSFQGVEFVELTSAIFGGNLMSSAVSSAPVSCLVEFRALGPPASGGWFLDDLGLGSIPPGVVGVPADPLPANRFALAQNNPNPFAGSTLIGFEVPRDAGNLKLKIFDLSGRAVRTLHEGALPAGRHARVWDGRDRRGTMVPAGVYFYRLTGDGFDDLRRMIRLDH